MFNIPVELVLRVFEALDMRSAFHLGCSDKGFKAIFDQHRQKLIVFILTRELSPFDELLQFVVSDADDLKKPLGPCLRRSVYHGKKVLAKGDFREAGDPAHQMLAPMALEDGHFDRILEVHRTVRGWEDLFTRHCWPQAQDRRSLTPVEAQRVRRALYTWMRYAFYFHGELPRPSAWAVAYGRANANRPGDVRCQFFRVLSDKHLGEMQNFWKVAVEVVKATICPSAESIWKNMYGTITKEEAARLGFGPQDQYNTIVDTFLKLTPDQILFYANRQAAYSKERLVREVQLSQHDFTRDQQSLIQALALAAILRWRMRTSARPTSGGNGGGSVVAQGRMCPGRILDDEDEDDQGQGIGTLRKMVDQEGERALEWSLPLESGGGNGAIAPRGKLDGYACVGSW